VVFAGVVAFVTMRDVPEPVPPVAEVAPLVEAATPVVETAPVAASEQVAAPPTAEGAPVTDPVPNEAAPAPMAPVLDVVRVDAEGNAVIAGRAAPQANVVLRLDGELLETVAADTAGNFVALVIISPSDRARVLSLEAIGADGVVIAGADSVLIAPFAGAVASATTATETADAVAEATPMEATVTETVTTEAAPRVATDSQTEVASADTAAPQSAPSQATEVANAPSEAAAAAPAAEEPQAPTVLIAGQDGVRVAQGAETQDSTKIQLDAITYDDAGNVTLAGRGPAQAQLRVTLDNTTVSTNAVGDSGQWSVPLSGVAPGTYTLRIEQLDATGAVSASVETPFLREDPARIRDNPMLVEPGSSVITVQRGFTLWGIAEANFGNGILYVQIFQENSADIRDPDLIYPGQIFALPDLPRTSSAP
jgi:nucleoid-associated protein YgaU